MHRLKVVSIIAGLALVAGVFLIVDPAGVINALANVPVGHVVAALLIVQIQIVASALRWRFTAARLGHHIPIGLAIREYYLGSVMNQILPGGIAGDAARVYRVKGEETGAWKRAAAAVALERLSGQLAFFLLSFIGLIAWLILIPEQLPIEASKIMWFVLTAAAVVSVAIVVFRRLIGRRLGRFGPDLSAVFWSDGAMVVQVGLSSLIVGTYVATFLLASDAVGATLPPIAAVTIIPLCLLTMLVPIGIGGWGTREAAAAALWPLFGFTGAEGLAASLLYGVFSLAGTALPGLLAAGATLLPGTRRGN
ncbi:flippase-like domain-containing protein [Ciceribacter sp. L1K23]|uniref:lysylphosphatidylglycerol synthase transmembrane domain-containing protein n=1 Tax=Ciceribacter sp. L1K23 TaxID=2820276 RepID=UPI001B83E839|nr:lysylphosphatidylglycerol synthase transmembrane domain-containing protein [Ciceribacter sp. L1K23]MBR0558310.1 flippase-like domain-containing protein [Ciceribacter sp. L1K23]